MSFVFISGRKRLPSALLAWGGRTWGREVRTLAAATLVRKVAADLLSGEGLIASSDRENWFYILGGLSEGCYMGWPVLKKAFAVSGDPYFEFDSQADSTWQPLVLCQLDRWSLWDVAFRSPQY